MTPPRKAAAAPAPSTPAQPNSVTGTPLRIPYGNKDVALKLGARYGSAGWYARLELIFLLSASGGGYTPADDVRCNSLVRPKFLTCRPDVQRPRPFTAGSSIYCGTKKVTVVATEAELGRVAR